ncbi:MAG: glycosyltransferase family 4 protein [Candidatus Coatesbacteria bacterium]
MKVTVSNIGRHWAFHLARELDRRGLLARLITGYPASRAVQDGVDRSRVVSILRFQAAQRLWSRLPGFLRRGWDPTARILERYDRAAAALIPAGTTVFAGWGDVALHSFHRARELGAKTVLERGSTHVTVQCALLREEYERAGITPDLPGPAAVERALAEYAAADRIAIPSAFVRRSFLAQGVSEAKLIQVPYGVDLGRFAPPATPSPVFRVIFCGTLCVRKGVHYLLQAFHELALPGAELWLIGPVAGEIRPALARWGGPAVRVLGTRAGPELVALYGQGSVFCLPSIEEGLAMVQAEAMACGLPVICTTNTGGGDIVREGVDGWVLPVRDVVALKEKIELCWRDRERCAAMGRSAAVRARDFGWGAYGDRMVAAYRDLVGERAA